MTTTHTPASFGSEAWRVAQDIGELPTDFSVEVPTDATPDLAPDSEDAQLRGAFEDAEWYCGRCAYYTSPPRLNEPGGCTLVTGPIEPRQVCNQFQAEAEPTDMETLPTPPIAGGTQVVDPVEPETEERDEAEDEEEEIVEELIPLSTKIGDAVADGVVKGLLRQQMGITKLQEEDEEPEAEEEVEEEIEEDRDRPTEAALPATAPLVLIVEGEETADNRIVDEDALTWRDLPLSLTRNHDPDQIVGRLDAIDRTRDLDQLVAAVRLAESEGRELTREEYDRAVTGSGNTIVAFAVFDLGGEEGRDAARQVDGGFLLGVSVEIGNEDVEFECLETAEEGNPLGIPAGQCLRLLERTTSGRIGAVSVVPFQAIESARVISAEDNASHPDDEPERDASYDDMAAEMLTFLAELENENAFAVIGAADLPITERELDWDGAAARRAVAEMCTEGDTLDVTCMSRAFFLRRDDLNPETQSAYGLGFADVVNGRLQAIPRGIFAVAAVLSGGRGGIEGLSGDERAQLEGRVCAYYDRMREQFDDETIQCPLRSSGAVVSSAWQIMRRVPAIVASGGKKFPGGWFEDPQLAEPTPWTMTEDGQVYGHAAEFGTCHISVEGVCVEAPHSKNDYAYYLKREVEGVADCPVSLGTITLGTGHAPLRSGVGATVDHYENTGTQAAYVNTGEDERGIWVAGAVRRALTDDQRTQLAASWLSGDWRTVAGGLNLVALLAVNTPGFPPVAQGHFASGHQTALVAAGIVASTSCGCQSMTECSCGQPTDAERLAQLESVIAAAGIQDMAIDRMGAEIRGSRDPDRVIAELSAFIHS